MRWKGEEIEGGGGEGEDPARSRYDPAERGRIRWGPAVGSRTDLESRIMPRPCWNFWGPYWPISRVSDHLRAGPGPGPRSLRVAPPLPPPIAERLAHGAIQRYVHRGRAHGFLLPPHPSRTVPSRESSLPSSRHLFLFALETSRRREPTTPRAHIFLGLYYYCRGSTQMVSSTRAGSSAPRKGPLFFSLSSFYFSFAVVVVVVIATSSSD